MARMISTCQCGTKMIRDYFEACPTGGRGIATLMWVRPDGERVCLGYEQDGCGMCRWHAQGRPHADCPDCGGPMRHRFTMKDVKATHSDRIKCGAKCHTATSDTCTCECDGMNHGRALRVQLVAAQEPPA